MENNIALSVQGITKLYPGVVALEDVSIDFVKGEVHALIGENGAGKSTLIKAITGAIAPEKGQIVVSGRAHSQMMPHEARVLGIEAIYQEFNLVPTLSVAENIFLGARLTSGPMIDLKLLARKAQDILTMMQVPIDPLTPVGKLTVAYQQMVEIAKAISNDAKILIMDEPTAPLTVAEVRILFRLIDDLKKKGVTIIYISHRLEELFEISDRLTIMRDGRKILTTLTKDITRPELVKHMVGREVVEKVPARNIKAYGDVVLEAKNLCGNGVKDISFHVRKGEVLGLAGLVGAGRTETARLLFGADPLDSGEIIVDGQTVSMKSPADAIRLGIGLVPEDRKQHGAVLGLTIDWNITLPIIRKLSKNGVIRAKQARAISEKYSNDLRVKTPSLDQLVKNLSGGNQQKVVLAKWLANECKVLILDEPTRGIDVGAKQEIYQLINSLAEDGLAVIVISSEMDEILGLSDRIIVLSEGEYTGSLEKEEFSQEKVLELASGSK